MASISMPIGRDGKIIALICGPHALSHFYYVSLIPLFPAFMAAFSLNAFEVGLIMTAFALAAGSLQTPVGFLVDRMGGRRVLICGLILEGCAIGAMGFAGAYWQLLALAAIAGLGHTVFHPADYAILSSTVSEQRMGRAFSIHSFTGYLGFAVAPLFMFGIKEAASWQAAVMTAGSFGLIAAALLWRNGGLLDEQARAVAAARSSTPEKKEKKSKVGLLEGIRLLVSVPILMCFLYFVLQQLGNGGVRNFLIVALNQLYGTPEVVASTALTCLMVGSSGGILSGGFVADKFGPRVATAFATLVPAGLLIASIGVFELPSVALFVVITLAGFLMGLLVPSRDLLLRSVTPPGSMGKVMGFASTGANFGGAIIPAVVGYVMTAFGPQWVFWISALFIGGAFVTFVTVGSRQASGANLPAAPESQP